MIWYVMWYDMLWYDMWCDMIWNDVTWYDMMWYDMMWYDIDMILFHLKDDIHIHIDMIRWYILYYIILCSEWHMNPYESMLYEQVISYK